MRKTALQELESSFFRGSAADFGQLLHNTHAKALLKHYPTYADIEQAHKALPDTFGPVPPFSRLHSSPQTEAVIQASTQAPRKNGPEE